MPDKTELYDSEGNPTKKFNKKIIGWLDKSLSIPEHVPPKAFETLLEAYLEEYSAVKVAAGNGGIPSWQTHRALLSNLTKLMLGVDITAEISERLTSESINVGGFRSTLSQGVAKNTGENFINAIVYALADALAHQDEVIVDKGMPVVLKEAMTLRRTFRFPDGNKRELEIPVEGDFCVFSRTDPSLAIIGNAKTRLKEVFHIGTMWALFFDMIGDEYTLEKWGLTRSKEGKRYSTDKMHYIFATADMIPPKGRRTQGGDVERNEPRNLIAADASFFDYVFVSKQGIPHVAITLSIDGPKESLFHELGCLLDLIKQKYEPLGFSFA